MIDYFIDYGAIVLEQCFIHVPLILGAYISFSLLQVPDLSLEAAYVTGGLFTATLLPYIQLLANPFQLFVACAVSMIGGAVVGLTSSLLTKKAHFSHLLSSIVTTGFFYGINQVIAGSYVSISGYTNLLIGSVNVMSKHPEIFLLGLISLSSVGLFFFLLRTQLGYCFAVYGNNPLFFKHYGINATYIFVTGIVIANMFAGLTGYFFAQSNGFAEINMATGKSLFCITALILARIVFKDKKPIQIAAPLVGIFFYFVLQQVLLKSGFNLRYFTAVQSVVVTLLIVVLGNKKSDSLDNLGV